MVKPFPLAIPTIVVLLALIVYFFYPSLIKNSKLSDKDKLNAIIGYVIGFFILAIIATLTLTLPDWGNSQYDFRKTFNNIASPAIVNVILIYAVIIFAITTMFGFLPRETKNDNITVGVLTVGLLTLFLIINFILMNRRYNRVDKRFFRNSFYKSGYITTIFVFGLIFTLILLAFALAIIFEVGNIDLVRNVIIAALIITLSVNVVMLVFYVFNNQNINVKYTSSNEQVVKNMRRARVFNIIFYSVMGLTILIVGIIAFDQLIRYRKFIKDNPMIDQQQVEEFRQRKEKVWITLGILAGAFLLTAIGSLAVLRSSGLYKAKQKIGVADVELEKIPVVSPVIDEFEIPMGNVVEVTEAVPRKVRIATGLVRGPTAPTAESVARAGGIEASNALVGQTGATKPLATVKPSEFKPTGGDLFGIPGVL